MLYNDKQGFSLIEIVIAMVIFAVISSMCYSLLTTVINTRQRTQERNIRLSQLQDTMQLLERDIMHFADRAITISEEDVLSALFIDRDAGMFEFSRAHAPNAFNAPRSSLQRVRYRIFEQQLIRDIWQRVDYTPNTPIGSQTMLQGVEHMTLYVWKDDAFEREWVAVMTTNQDIIIEEGLNDALLNDAKAIKIELDTNMFGTIERYMMLTRLNAGNAAPPLEDTVGLPQ